MTHRIDDTSISHVLDTTIPNGDQDKTDLPAIFQHFGGGIHSQNRVL